MTSEEEQIVAAQVDDLLPNALVITSGARGIEAVINAAAAQRGLKRMAVLPAVTTWIDWASLEGAVLMQTRCAPHQRDEKIVAAARHLRVIGIQPPVALPRSGTWSMARMAQQKGILER